MNVLLWYLMWKISLPILTLHSERAKIYWDQKPFTTFLHYTLYNLQGERYDSAEIQGSNESEWGVVWHDGMSVYTSRLRRVSVLSLMQKVMYFVKVEELFVCWQWKSCIWTTQKSHTSNWNTTVPWEYNSNKDNTWASHQSYNMLSLTWSKILHHQYHDKTDASCLTPRVCYVVPRLHMWPWGSVNNCKSLFQEIWPTHSAPQTSKKQKANHRWAVLWRTFRSALQSRPTCPE